MFRQKPLGAGSRRHRRGRGSRHRGMVGWEALEDRRMLASVNGQKFHDLNANGEQDAGEPGPGSSRMSGCEREDHRFAVQQIDQDTWQAATEVRRNSPTVAQLASRLGLTDAELDDLFIDAVKIEA